MSRYNHVSGAGIALEAARREWQIAQQHCPHWDYESGSGEHECCRDLCEAGERLTAARKAYCAEGDAS